MAGGDEKSPFDQAKDAEAAAAAVEDLKAMVKTAEGADGQTYPVTKLDCIHGQWRQTAVHLLRLLDPEAYKKYRDMKYGDGPNPDLETRRKAYIFAVTEFMKFYGIAGF